MLLGLLALAPLGPQAGAVVPPAEVRVLEVDGVISPVASRYLRRELTAAQRDRVAAVVVRLDTPGGLDRSMREMTTALMGSSVPVLVWVGPSGARAASAGLFLTLSAHIAAMAPGTDIGAAHPVGLGGGEDDVAIDKAVADAAAFARSLAELRGRNADWAERAVLESAAISAEEALELGVIDRVDRSVADLLQGVDGLMVQTDEGFVVLQTAGLEVVERGMPLLDRVLQAITDPNIAYVLLMVGVIGIIAELYSPGALFPGILGALCLILAFVGMGSLPVSALGVALVLLGVGLFIGDLASEGLGLLAIPGVLAFVFGSLVLYQPLSSPSPSMPAVRINPWLIALMTLVLLGFFVIVVRALIRAAAHPVSTGVQALLGRVGRTTSALAPSGTVRVEGEIWSAVAEDPPLPPDTEVEIVGFNGVTLQVRSLRRGGNR